MRDAYPIFCLETNRGASMDYLSRRIIILRRQVEVWKAEEFLVVIGRLYDRWDWDRIEIFEVESIISWILSDEVLVSIKFWVVVQSGVFLGKHYRSLVHQGLILCVV